MQAGVRRLRYLLQTRPPRYGLLPARAPLPLPRSAHQALSPGAALPALSARADLPRAADEQALSSDSPLPALFARPGLPRDTDEQALSSRAALPALFARPGLP